MKPNLVPYAVKTVPPTFSWDEGPLMETGTNISNFLTSLSECTATNTQNEEGVQYIGYAPFFFLSLSSNPGTVTEYHKGLKRHIDFGDYYNDSQNIDIRTGLKYEIFNHVYIMPGTYTITFNSTEYLEVQTVSLNAYGGCLQKHCLNWTFFELTDCSNFAKNRITWASTKPGEKFEKKWKYEPCEEISLFSQGLHIQDTGINSYVPPSWQWENFETYVKNGPLQGNLLTWNNTRMFEEFPIRWLDSQGPCIKPLDKEQPVWQWRTILDGGNTDEFPYTSDVTWEETATGGPKTITWDESLDHSSTIKTTVLSSVQYNEAKTAYVKVLEIPPKAFLTCVQSEDRLSPLTVRLSPKETMSGSFPIEKIVWDLGDGSPLLTQRRWANSIKSPFIHNNFISGDPEDPRNFDVIYTYTRCLTGPTSFYPSITAYASSTNTSDTASTMVGPIKLPNISTENINLIQTNIIDGAKILMGQVGDSVVFWKNENKITPITTKYNYNHFGYYSNDKTLISEKSKIYRTTYSNSSPVRNHFGVWDVDNDGNVDEWETNKYGIIKFQLKVFHPYSYGTIFRFDDPLPIQNTTITYDGPGSGATIVKNLTARGVDIDLDGKLDVWVTDNEGRLSWTPEKQHPYSLMAISALSSYYIDKLVPYNNKTIVWNSLYSDATAVSGLLGIDDIDMDGNVDSWLTTDVGVLSWTMITVHPYQWFNYFLDEPTPIKNISVIYNGKGSGATVAANVSGEGYLSNSINIDKWSTNSLGVITWSIKQVHPYNLLGYYSDTPTLTSGISVLYNGVGSNATPIPDAYGISLVNDDPNEISWQTNDTGIVTWSLLSTHPYRNLGYFTDTEEITSNNTKLWNGVGTAATVVALASGYYDYNNDTILDTWQTDVEGVITLIPDQLIGRFWLSKYDNQSWFDLNNWYVDKNLTVKAEQLPNSNTNVVLSLGSKSPVVDLTDSLWIAPSSIDLKYSSVIFTNTTSSNKPNIKYLNSNYYPVIYKS